MNTENIAKEIIKAFKRGNKLLIVGNGGSATQASHMAGELVGKFKYERKALPAIALTTDMAIITAVANDYGYKYIFSRQIEALGKEGDVLLIFSTSGKSENCLEAKKKAEEMKIKVIEMTIGNSSTPYIQGMHLVELHEICGMVEEVFR